MSCRMLKVLCTLLTVVFYNVGSLQAAPQKLLVVYSQNTQTASMVKGAQQTIHQALTRYLGKVIPFNIDNKPFLVSSELVNRQLSEIMEEEKAQAALVFSLEGTIKKDPNPNIMWEGSSKLQVTLEAYHFNKDHLVRRGFRQVDEILFIGTGTWSSSQTFQEKQFQDTTEKLINQWPNKELDHFFTSHFSQESLEKSKDDLTPLVEKMEKHPTDPTKWLFMIAVENYDAAEKVIYANNSAHAFKAAAQKAFGIGERNTYALIDDKATSGAIEDRLTLLLRNIKTGDIVYFYYSGHGVPDPGSGEAFLLPKDKYVEFVKDDRFKISQLYRKLSDSKAAKVIAFIDACFSGKTDNALIFKGVAPGLIRTKKIRFDESKMVVMTAGKNTQFSNSFDEKGHRMFSYYLIKSLATRSNLNIDTLYKSVSLQVRDQSHAKGDIYLQEPQLYGSQDIRLSPL